MVHEFVEMAGTPKYDGDLFYQVTDFKKLPGTELPSGMAVLPEQILVAELVEVTQELNEVTQELNEVTGRYSLRVLPL